MRVQADPDGLRSRFTLTPLDIAAQNWPPDAPSPTGSALAPAGRLLHRHPPRLPLRRLEHRLAVYLRKLPTQMAHQRRPPGHDRQYQGQARIHPLDVLETPFFDAAARFQRPGKYAYNTPSDTVILHNSPRLLGCADRQGRHQNPFHGHLARRRVRMLTNTTLTVIGGSFRSGHDGGRNSIVREPHFHLGQAPGSGSSDAATGFRAAVFQPRDHADPSPQVRLAWHRRVHHPFGATARPSCAEQGPVLAGADQPNAPGGRRAVRDSLIDVGLAVADAHAAHARQLLGRFAAPCCGSGQPTQALPFLRWALCLRLALFLGGRGVRHPVGAVEDLRPHRSQRGPLRRVKACMRCSKKPRRTPSRSPAPVTSCLGRVTSISVVSCGSKNDFFVLGHPLSRTRWQWGWRMLSKEVRSLLQKH